MAREQEWAQRGDVAGAQRGRELEDTRVLCDDVTSARVVVHLVEGRIAQRCDPEAGGDGLAGATPFGVCARRQRPRQP